MLLSILQLSYLHNVKPLDKLKLNNLELMNEYTILLIIYQMLLYTNYVPSPQDRYDFGWTSCIIIGLSVLVNLWSIIAFSVKDLYYKIRWKIYSRKVRKAFLKRVSTNKPY